MAGERFHCLLEKIGILGLVLDELPRGELLKILSIFFVSEAVRRDMFRVQIDRF